MVASSARSRCSWTARRSTSARPSSGRWSPRWRSPAAGRSRSTRSWTCSGTTHAPPGVTATLQAYVSGLRRAIEPDRERRAPATVLVTGRPGYALRVPDEALDAGRSRPAVRARHRALQPLAPCGPPRARPRRARPTRSPRLDEALALWRGTPYAELEDAPRRSPSGPGWRSCGWSRWRTGRSPTLALGHHAHRRRRAGGADRRAPAPRAALGAAGARAGPVRAPGGRAGRARARCATVLDEELGLEPGAELRDLQTAVLRQDPALEWAPRTPAPEPAARPPSPPPSRSAAAESSRWPPGRWSAATATWRRWSAPLDAAPSGRAVVRRADRRPGHRQVPAGRRAGRCGPAARAAACWSGGAPRTTAPRRCGRGRRCSSGSAPSLLRRRDRRRRTTTARQFRAWERIVRTVRDAARERAAAGRPRRPALGGRSHAAGAAAAGRDRRPTAGCWCSRTWRAHPEPTGALAEVAEALARRHARAGRAGRAAGAEAVAEVFEAVARPTRPSEQADALRQRTDGNPFFLVEYARLARRARRPRRGCVAEEHPPTARARRAHPAAASGCPSETVTTLRSAAVIGRQFDLATLAAVADVDEDDLLDVLEPAAGRRAGARGRHRPVPLRPRPGPRHPRRDSWRRPPGPAARPGAPASLDGRPRPGDRGGAALARRRPDVRRPRLARRRWPRPRWPAGCYALRGGRGPAPRGATPRWPTTPTPRRGERYDVLMRAGRRLPLVGRCGRSWSRPSSRRSGSAEADRRPRAGRLGGDLDHPGRAVAVGAARARSTRASSRALRGSLDRLPPRTARCAAGCCSALANELYYGASFEERRALVDEGLAMARRLEGRGPAARRLPDRVRRRCGARHRCRAARARRRGGGARGAHRQRARHRGGRHAAGGGARRAGPAARDVGGRRRSPATEAERLRMLYGVMVLDSLVLPWHAMAGRFDECDGCSSIAAARAAGSPNQRRRGHRWRDDLAEHLAGASARAVLEHLAFEGAVPVLGERRGLPLAGWRGGEGPGATTPSTVDLDTERLLPARVVQRAESRSTWVTPTRRRAPTRLAPYAGRPAYAGSGNARAGGRLPGDGRGGGRGGPGRHPARRHRLRGQRGLGNPTLRVLGPGDPRDLRILNGCHLSCTPATHFRAMQLRQPLRTLTGGQSLHHIQSTARCRKRFVTSGYAWVDVDVRGTGASYGSRFSEWSPDEIRDGAEVVDWIVSQPWSDGKVGALGSSYGGAAAEFLLVNRHPAVRAIAPRFALFDAYPDIAFPGGIHATWFTETWGRAKRCARPERSRTVAGQWLKLLVTGCFPSTATVAARCARMRLRPTATTTTYMNRR